VLSSAEIEGRELVLATLADNFRRYVLDVDAPPATALLAPRLG
jgi:hypothetical protein